MAIAPNNWQTANVNYYGQNKRKLRDGQAASLQSYQKNKKAEVEHGKNVRELQMVGSVRLPWYYHHTGLQI